MAPEVLTGKNTSADPAIDIFSMGIILYALVSGRLPFEGDDHAVKSKIAIGDFSFSNSLVISDECKDLI